jgi:type II secretory pathway pseudopilin PulG
MIGISFIGVLIALAVFAIAALILLTKLRPAKPRRPEKWEKAAIMKQLLALSERENSLAATVPSVTLRAPASRQGRLSSNAPLKTTAKTSLAMRSKTS